MTKQATEMKLPRPKLFIALLISFLIVFIGSIAALANENSIVVLADVLNVRYGPGLSHDIMTQVAGQDRLQVIDEQNEWYKVYVGEDQIGWVASWLVEKDEIAHSNPEYGQVVVPEASLFELASDSSNILGTVYEGTELEVVYQEGAWYQVIYMGQVAWIHEDTLEIIDITSRDQTAEAVEIDDYDSYVEIIDQTVPVYTEPTGDSEIIYTAFYGEELPYIYSEGDWYYVEISPDNYGFIGNWGAEVHVNKETQEVTVPADEQADSAQARSKTQLSEATIVIDAGHGGSDPGAISVDETLYEKTLTLQTAHFLKNRLADSGANVILTRADDSDVGLAARAQLAADHAADLFISLHYDSLEVANMYSGTTTYYYDENDLELAQTINQYLAVQGSLPNNGVKFGNYQVLRDNHQPALLLELGYMNHYVDVEQIQTESYQIMVVEAIYQGLKEYFGQ